MAGSSAPFTNFDPMSFSADKTANQLKLYREAEVSSDTKRMLYDLRQVVWALDRDTRRSVTVLSQI
jgi:hypothetical protein